MSLQLKTYHANSVEQAMTAARKELGPDAMLVHSQKSSGDARRLGQYEVVFARPGVPAQAASAAAAIASTVLAPSAHVTAPEKNPLTSELAELKQMIRSLYRLSAETQTSGSASVAGPAASLLLGHLIESGMDHAIAAKLLEAWEDARQKAHRAEQAPRFDQFLVPYLQSLIMPVMQTPRKAQQEIVAVAGPPGAGKTTTLAKLAAVLGLKQRRTVQFICLDGERIAGSEQLRCYASIMGSGFELLPAPELLAGAVRENRDKGLILIDTPGYGPAERGQLFAAAQAVSSLSEAQTHLVLPATMRTCDMQRASDLFQPFNAAYTLFTRLDETDRLGGILSETIRSSRPISYLGSGQCIPDDLERASADTLVTQALPELAAQASAQ